MLPAGAMDVGIFVCRMMFGNLGEAEARASIGLFAEAVMPHLTSS